MLNTHIMKLSLTLFLLILSLNSLAEVTAEFGAYSNFIWRGTTFTENRPAIQGSIDFEESHGLFVGAFASNAEFSDEAMGKNSSVTQEVDLMIGKRWYGEDWELQIMYGKFLFPNADVFNTSEFNILLERKNFFIELSHMDDYFGYQSTYQYVRLGHKWKFKESLDGSLSVGYNAFNRPKGSLKSRCLDESCSESAFTTSGAGNPDYIDIYLVNRKTFERGLVAELAINWTNRYEYLAEETSISKEKSRDFAIIIALIKHIDL
jgi:uncharacterized protein (TIGR02001 family)